LAGASESILIYRHDFCSLSLPPLLNNRSTIWFDARFKFARNAFQENALCAIIEEAHMPLSPEQEALCERLEKGESTPTAATSGNKLVRLTTSGIVSVAARSARVARRDDP